MENIIESVKDRIIGILSADLIDDEKMEAVRAKKECYMERFVQRHKTSLDHLG